MTLIEKLRKEHPEEMNCSGIPMYCPTKYGYAECPLYCEDIEYGNARKRCTDCWNREIPEEKENKPMKKTKAMLEEELEQKKNEIEELKKELVKIEKYKQYDEMAGEIKAIYDSFANAGFNRDQAYEILIILLQNQKAAAPNYRDFYMSTRRK